MPGWSDSTRPSPGAGCRLGGAFAIASQDSCGSPRARPWAGLGQFKQLATSISTMFVKVRLFAMLRERAGSESLQVELEDGATVRDAIDAIASEHGLGDVVARTSMVMAVNRQYAEEERPLAEGDELALIPPVSGGDDGTATDLGEEFRTGEGYERSMERVGN